MPRVRSVVFAVPVLAMPLLAACGADTQSRASEAKVAEAAAKIAREVRSLGPGDLQMVSLDRTVALEVVGDSVHVFMANSQISVPVTYIENVKYADNRLRFDIKGIGMKMFEVGDGTDGAVFTQVDALQFVQTVLSRQNRLENPQ
ncbi:hypothetical protein [Gemmatimonas sp.]